MIKKINTKFVLKKESHAGGRLGEIQFGKKGKIQTPAFFPAICAITGPPGFGRNGAHYKYIKRIMCRDWKHTHFLTEILHFADYLHSKDALERWLKKPFQSWMDEMMIGGNKDSEDNQGHSDDFDYGRNEEPYEACFFLDSGGFKLLSNIDFSIEKFGYPTNAESILKLQTFMGGDIIASLDYPLPPVEYDPKTLRDLQRKSIQNGIKLLRKLSDRKRDEPKPLAYLAVHGVDHETSREYTKKLLNRLDKSNIKYSSFGFAIGSLVPRRTNRALVVSIVKGVKDAINNHRNGFYSDKPVHAFGMSGDIVPTLAFLGVDTFDSNSFVQGGKNLNYILPYSREYSAVRETRSLDEIDIEELYRCGCRICKEYSAEHLDKLKKYSRMKAQGSHKLHGIQFPGAYKMIIKSAVYSFLALHALEVEFHQFEIIRNEIKKNTLRRYVRKYAEKTNSQASLARAYEAATGTIIERPKSRKVSIDLTHESFTIPETYKPPEEKEILVILPCTKDKPYKFSRSHEAIRSALYKDQRIHIVTISGLYGPVPEELEEEPEILEYDYMLSSQAHKQADFIKDRLVSYLKRYGNSYRQIFAYVTAKAYRDVAEKALKKYGRGVLLPQKPKERTSKEFLKRENIKELQKLVGLHLEGATFLREQLKLELR